MKKLQDQDKLAIVTHLSLVLDASLFITMKFNLF